MKRKCSSNRSKFLIFNEESIYMHPLISSLILVIDEFDGLLLYLRIQNGFNEVNNHSNDEKIP
jgi:hypothetical protein